MKKLIFALFATMSFGFYSCAQNLNEKIGVNENGVFKVTSSLEKTKSDWAILLKNQKNGSELVNFEIRSGIDTTLNNETYYFLLGKNGDNTTKVAALLTLQDGNFYLLNEEGYASGGTVTCTGCAYGCNPYQYNKKWYCDMDCGDNCTKSVTVSKQ